MGQKIAPLRLPALRPRRILRFMSDDEKPDEKSNLKKNAEALLAARKSRQGEALRTNLHRRKAQKHAMNLSAKKTLRRPGGGGR